MNELMNLYIYYMEMADAYKGSRFPEFFKMFEKLARLVAREIEVVYA